MSKRLTIKQRTFVKAYINNKGNGTQAALEAYDTNSVNTAKNIASENLTNPNIQEQIEQSLSSRGLSLNTFLGNINDLASVSVEKVSADVKLKANVEILKLIGAYPGKNSVHTNINIKGKLKGMQFSDLTNYREKAKTFKSEIEDDNQ